MMAELRENLRKTENDENKQSENCTEKINTNDVSGASYEEAMTDQKAENIMTELVSYVSSSDINGVKEYIISHKIDIIKIYDQYGSGCEYLFAAYRLVYLSNDKFALAYQICLENEIDKDVLFLDE